MTTHTLPHSSLELRFTLHADSPKKFIDAFRQLKAELEIHEHGDIMSAWVNELNEQKIGNAVDRQRLNRSEGGIGGGCNMTNRQLRLSEYRNLLGISSRKENDDMNDIKLLALDSDDHSSVWSIADVQVFGRALRIVLLQRLYKLAMGWDSPGDNCLTMLVSVHE